jgi:hypothetical protein
MAGWEADGTPLYAALCPLPSFSAANQRGLIPGKVRVRAWRPCLRPAPSGPALTSSPRLLCCLGCVARSEAHGRARGQQRRVGGDDGIDHNKN